MTIEQMLLNHLVERGFFQHHAQAVLEIVKGLENTKSMSGRWADSIEGYQKELLVFLIVLVRKSAVEWIDANMPQAFFKPMFMDEETE